MPLTPPEIVHWQFRRRLFGYSVKDVNAFVQQVSETVAQLMEENRTIKEEREKLLERLQVYQAIEQQLQNALVVAEKTAEDIKRQARQEAELILAQARQEAERINDKVRSLVHSEMEKVERLKQLQVKLTTELKHLLLSYLELLEKSGEVTVERESEVGRELLD